MQYKYLYGPIPSRRLGISLGIDPIPFKTCPLNCIYCECGATTEFTMERKEYIPTQDLLRELDHFMAHNQSPDFITFSGSGEPTLYKDLGFVIDYIHNNFLHTKVAVITNSIMLADKILCRELMKADLVAPSQDAISEETYKKIDVPMKNIDINKLPQYLREFAIEYMSLEKKELWIEIFIVEGINDTDQEITLFIKELKKIPYSKIQLNRLDRIGTKLDLKPASMERLYYIQDRFIENGLKNVEIIGKFKKRDEIKSYNQSLEDIIMTCLTRRSTSLKDLLIMTSSTVDDIGKYLDVLGTENKIIQKNIDGEVSYKIFHK
ncbi:MAG: radical SAM protein [Spirochaetota bacterium]|nr:radical SAM protein [Spirochaetota bacterium]